MTRGAETKSQTARRFVGRVTLLSLSFALVAATLVARAGGSVRRFVLRPFAEVIIGGMSWVTALVILAAVAALIGPLAAALPGRPEASAAEGAAARTPRGRARRSGSPSARWMGGPESADALTAARTNRPRSTGERFS